MIESIFKHLKFLEHIFIHSFICDNAKTGSSLKKKNYNLSKKNRLLKLKVFNNSSLVNKLLVTKCRKTQSSCLMNTFIWKQHSELLFIHVFVSVLRFYKNEKETNSRRQKPTLIFSPIVG